MTTAEALRSRRRHWNNQVRRHAQKIPDEPALRYLDQTLTWRHLHDRSNALAAALGKNRIGAGDRVLILMPNRLEYLEALLAITAAGAIAVPVNIRMTAAEILFVANDAGAKGLIADASMAAVASTVAGDAASVEVVVAVEGAEHGHLRYEELIADHL